MKTRRVIIKGGTIRFVYDDALAPLLEAGQAEVKRASHVEPIMVGGVVKWQADMSPSGPNVILGPFDTRNEALTAEVSYLEANILGKSHELNDLPQ